jgi:hypothetical protein
MLRYRKRKAEDNAATLPVFSPNPAAMGIDNRPADR